MMMMMMMMIIIVVIVAIIIIVIIIIVISIIIMAYFIYFFWMPLLHQPADFKSMLANYINLHSFLRLNEFVELLNTIHILAQNPFLAAFNE